MAGVGHHALWAGCVGSACVDVAHPARLSQHVFEAWHGRHARGGRGTNQPDIANARDYKIHRRHRPCLCGSSIPLCLHHHRLRRGLRVSFPDRFGHHAEDDKTRIANPEYRLRRDGDRDAGRVDGDDRRVRAATGPILCDQHQGYSHGSRRKSFRRRVSRDGERNADACNESG